MGALNSVSASAQKSLLKMALFSWRLRFGGFFGDGHGQWRLSVVVGGKIVGDAGGVVGGDAGGVVGGDVGGVVSGDAGGVVSGDAGGVVSGDVGGVMSRVREGRVGTRSIGLAVSEGATLSACLT